MIPIISLPAEICYGLPSGPCSQRIGNISLNTLSRNPEVNIACMFNQNCQTMRQYRHYER